jgi:hypothetical protein
MSIINEDHQNMANSLDSSNYQGNEEAPDKPRGWVRMGAVAVGSALAGGLLAAWWYRKTLNQLRDADEDGENPQFGIQEEEPADEA